MNPGDWRAAEMNLETYRKRMRDLTGSSKKMLMATSSGSSSVGHGKSIIPRAAAAVQIYLRIGFAAEDLLVLVISSIARLNKSES